MMFDKKEALHLLATILILSIVFGWNDGQPTFIANTWILNFLKIIFIVSIAVLAHELSHKLTARKFDANSTYHLLTIKHLIFKKELKKPLPLYSLIALFLALTSKGKLFFTGIGGNTITSTERQRTGRKYPLVSGYEQALILLSGPLANVFLVLLASVLEKSLSTEFPTFISVNLLLALWYMIPLPGFDGNGILFGSRFVYVFGLSFILSAFLLKFLSLPLTLGLSLLIAGISTLLYYWKD
ncbi:MAG TPA: hypothetical protein VFE88_04285 [Candidatus Nanoarchaeia archaeon]|nr:hypothetical protein [Candidatus Nanoarchaeia archaeon]